MNTSNVINFIKARNKTFDKVFLNVDYMHREIKSIYKEIDKVVLETNFSPRTKNMSSDEVINELQRFIDEDLPVWLRASCMCKPANYIYVAKNNKTVVINNETIMKNDINVINDINDKNDIDDEKKENDINKKEHENRKKKNTLVVTRSSEEELNISYDYYFHLDDWEDN